MSTSREKKPFSSCIKAIDQRVLTTPLCREVYGDLEVLPEFRWVVSDVVQHQTIQTHPFCDNLGLSEEEESAVIHVAPRSKEQQMRLAILSWSKSSGNEATLERFLEALYIGDEVELVEAICQKLLPNKISDDRKVVPQPVVSEASQLTKLETAPHKAPHEEEIMSPTTTPINPENGPFIKPVRVSSSGNVNPSLQRPPSDLETVKPVSATEQGSNHAAMAWTRQEVIPSGLLHDKDQLLQVSSKSVSGSSNSIQVEDNGLEKSLTFQGVASSPNLQLEARMNELERKMKEMGDELRGEDAKLRLEIDELKSQIQKKDSEILRLKKELQIEIKQKKDTETLLQMEQNSKKEMQRMIEELKNHLQERDEEIALLKEKKSLMNSHNEIDYVRDKSCDCFSEGGEDVCPGRLNSDEDTALVTNWEFEETNILGCGNFGIVFKGHCKDTGRELAFKVVRDINDKTIQSLEQEYNMLSTLRHRRIVSYLGVCYKPHPTHGQECLFIMTEFMPGGTLSKFYEDKGPLNETLTRRYTRQILQGAEYLHNQDIIHRDIKGSNIMRDTRGYVKLADFGSAKKIYAETSEEKRTSYLYGTAPWAAPEVLRSEPAQSQSDIWSIAATVVEMITAERPYASDQQIKNNGAIIYLVGKNELDPLWSSSMKKLVSEAAVSEDALTFLSECFKRVAEQRPSAKDLLCNFSFCQKDHNPQ